MSEIDFQTASEAGLESLSDLEVLAKAAHDDRILVSHDRRTIPIHFGDFIQTRTSPGVLLVSQNAQVLRVIEISFSVMGVLKSFSQRRQDSRRRKV